MQQHMIGVLLPSAIPACQAREATAAVLRLDGPSTRRPAGELSLYAWPAERNLPRLARAAVSLANALPGAAERGWLATESSGHRWRQGFMWPLTSSPGMAVGWITQPTRVPTWTRTELSLYALSTGEHTLLAPAGRAGTAILRSRQGAERLEVKLGEQVMTPGDRVRYAPGQPLAVRMPHRASAGAGLELVFLSPL